MCAKALGYEQAKEPKKGSGEQGNMQRSFADTETSPSSCPRVPALLDALKKPRQAICPSNENFGVDHSSVIYRVGPPKSILREPLRAHV